MNITKHQQNMTVQYCFPNNDLSCRKEVRTGPVYIFLFIVLSCISVCTVFLNMLVIISISQFKQLHTPTNLLILSLAVADLLVGLMVMPVNITQLIDSCWYLGKIACSISLLISNVLTSASLCSLVFIAFDRYIAVCDPLLYSTRVTVFKTALFIILGWFSSLFYVTMYLYGNDNFLLSQSLSRCHGECVVVIKYHWVIVDLVVSFVAPCSVILTLYSVIFKVARHQVKAVRAVMKSEAKVSSSSEAKAAKKLGTLIFFYLACWIPFYLSSLSADSLTSSSMAWTVFGWVVLINSSVNPLIYAIFYPWFRESTKYIVTCKIFKSSSSRFLLLPEHH